MIISRKMTSPLTTRRLIDETVPVAVVLLFWSVLSVFPHATIANGLRYAGIVMALLYLVVRGTQLAADHAQTAHPDDLERLLRENGRVALVAGVWFLAAFLVSVLAMLVELVAMMIANLPYPVAVHGPTSVATGVLNGVTFAFTATGVAAVLLYAIAVGIPRTRQHPTSTGNDREDHTVTEDSRETEQWGSD